MKRVLLTALLAGFVGVAAFGQGCAVCTKTAQGLESKSAKGLNKGILYLAFLPLGIMGTVGIVWWRAKSQE